MNLHKHMHQTINIHIQFLFSVYSIFSPLPVFYSPKMSSPSLRKLILIKYVSAPNSNYFPHEISTSQISYSLLEDRSGDHKYFRIDPELGFIYTQSVFDREAKSSYLLEVQSVDGWESARPGRHGQPNSGKHRLGLVFHSSSALTLLLFHLDLHLSYMTAKSACCFLVVIIIIIITIIIIRFIHKHLSEHSRQFFYFVLCQVMSLPLHCCTAVSAQSSKCCRKEMQ